MNVRNILELIVFAVFLAGWTIWGIYGGISGLTNSDYTEPSINAEDGKLCEVNITSAKEAYTIDHTLLGFIPTGTERFYLCESEDRFVPLLVKAGKSWYTENFGADGLAKHPLTVTGEVKDFDYELRRDIENITPRINGRGQVSFISYLSCTYKTKYILEIVSGLVTIAAAAAVIVTIKRGAGEAVGIALCAAAAALTVFVLLYADIL